MGFVLPHWRHGFTRYLHHSYMLLLHAPFLQRAGIVTDNVLHKDGKDYKHERQRHRTRRKEIINMKGKDTEQGGKRL